MAATAGHQLRVVYGAKFLRRRDFTQALRKVAMRNHDEDDPIEIDARRFQEFYNNFDDGRKHSTEGFGRAGVLADRIARELNKLLGKPPQIGKNDNPYWLGSKSTLEAWKAGSAGPRPRPKKVLRAIYEKWGFDISRTQIFANKVVVAEAMAELLFLEGVQLERSGEVESPEAILRIVKLEMLSSVRPIKDCNRRLLPARVKLGFGQLNIEAEAIPPTKSFRVTLPFLEAGTETQFGSAYGVTVLWDYGRLGWKVVNSGSSSPFITGSIMNVQLANFLDDVSDEIEFTVEMSQSDFEPIVYLEDSTGSWAADSEQKALHKARIMEQILRLRLSKRRRTIIASGRLRRK